VHIFWQRKRYWPGVSIPLKWLSLPQELTHVIDEAFGAMGSFVTKTVTGNPSCSARFAALYHNQKIDIAVEVTDEKIVTGSKNAWEDDEIELYFDRNNSASAMSDPTAQRRLAELARWDTHFRLLGTFSHRPFEPVYAGDLVSAVTPAGTSTQVPPNC
jgi:hypothetical protein